MSRSPKSKASRSSSIPIIGMLSPYFCAAQSPFDFEEDDSTNLVNNNWYSPSNPVKDKHLELRCKLKEQTRLAAANQGRKGSNIVIGMSKIPTDIMLDLTGRDFDEDPSLLYKLLRKRKWPNVIDRCKEFPEEASTWIYRLDYQKEHLRWRVLPIHAAIIMDAPLDVIEALLTAAPETVESADDRGSLPIHLCIVLGSSVSILRLLLKTCPATAVRPDGTGCTPSALLQESLHQNRGAAEDVLQKFLLTLDNNTENTKEESSDGFSSKISKSHDETVGTFESSRQPSLGALRATRLRIKVDNEENCGPGCKSPIQVAYIKNAFCSADESSLLTHEDSKGLFEGMLRQKLKEKHDTKIAELTERLSKNRQRVKEEVEADLQEKREKLKQKHTAELEGINVRQTTAVLKAQNDPKDNTNVLLMKLQTRQRAELQQLEDDARSQLEEGKKRVSEEFSKTFKEVEENFRLQMSTMKEHMAATTTDETACSDSTKEEHFTFQSARREQDDGGDEIVSREDLATPRKCQRHNSKMVDLKVLGSVTPGSTKATSVSEIDQKVESIMKKINEKFKDGLDEVHEVVNEIHAEMITANVDNTHQSKEFEKLVKDLDTKFTTQTDFSAAMLEKMQQTMDSLRENLETNQKISESLFVHIAQLQERLEEHKHHEQQLEAKMDEVAASSMMMCCGI